VLGRIGSHYKQQLCVTIGQDEIEVQVLEGHTNPAHVFSFASDDQDSAGDADTAHNKKKNKKQSLGAVEFRRISDMNMLRGNVCRHQFKPEASLVVQEFCSAYLGGAGKSTFERGVTPHRAELQVSDLKAMKLSGTELLLEGIKAGPLNEEVAKMAILEFEARGAEGLGDAEGAARLRERCKEYVQGVQESIRGDIVSGEHGYRWKHAACADGQPSANTLVACNLRKVDVVRLVGEGKTESGMALTHRICKNGDTSLNFWEDKKSKTGVGGSLWCEYLCEKNGLGKASSTQTWEESTPLAGRGFGGIGPVTAKVFKEQFGIVTAGHLASLTPTRATEIQKEIKEKKLVKNFPAGKMEALREKAINLVRAALVDVDSDEEDDDDGQMLHDTEPDELQVDR
jgi:hypothetical protein